MLYSDSDVEILGMLSFTGTVGNTLEAVDNQPGVNPFPDRSIETKDEKRKR